MIYLDQAKAQMCLVRRRLGAEPRAAPSLGKPGRGVAAPPSHVPHEVLGGLLAVPLLLLLAGLHLGQQRLAVRLVGLDDVLQLLHEEQLQHPLVRVQVGQLEQLPLQDVVVPAGWAEGGGGASGKAASQPSGSFHPGLVTHLRGARA